MQDSSQSLRSRRTLSLPFRMFFWEGQGLLAVKEMACDSYGLSFHWTLNYSRLKSLVVGVFPYTFILLLIFSPLVLSIFLSSSSCLFPSLTFPSVHPCMSFRPQPESWEDCALFFLFSWLVVCLLNGQWESSLSSMNGFLFEKAPPVHQTFPVHRGLCTAKGSSVMCVLQLCPPGACVQASSTSTLPFHNPWHCLLSLSCQCKPTLKGVHLIWQKTWCSYQACVLVFCWALTCSPWQTLVLLHAGWMWRNCGVFLFGL